MTMTVCMILAAFFFAVYSSGIYADDLASEPGALSTTPQNATSDTSGDDTDQPPESETVADIPLSQLVDEAVAAAEAASEAAGVEYYGKQRTGILGNRFWFLDVGVIFDNSDDDSIEMDTGSAFVTGFNFPLAKHIDLSLSIAYSKRSGTVRYYEQASYTVYDLYYDWYYYYYRPRTVYRTVLVEEKFDVATFTGSAALTLFIAPGNAVNPFITGGGFYVNQDIDSGGYSDSQSDEGFLFGGGIEFMLGQQISLIPSVIYSKLDEEDETAINVLLAYWYAFRHALRLSGSYGTESEDIAASVGWMYSF